MPGVYRAPGVAVKAPVDHSEGLYNRGVTPFRSYSQYLRERYGMPARRVCIDGGFGCPHRGRPDAPAGCIYCDGGGSGSPAPAGPPPPIAEQVDTGVTRARRRGDAALLLYFQSWSATFAPPARLRELYDSALSRADFRELIVATRPDCIDAERADLLASYVRPGFDVWVELGLQSALDRTLACIHRGHTVASFRTAFGLLRDRGLRVAVHLIFGLPGESHEDILTTASYVGALRPDGVKIHNLHVCRGTPLETLFRAGEVTVPSVSSHLRHVSEALEFLPSDVLIMRLTTDSPPARLLAPTGFGDKSTFARRLCDLMRREGRLQGSRAGEGEERPPERRGGSS
jgi:uncharacterized protein